MIHPLFAKEEGTQTYICLLIDELLSQKNINFIRIRSQKWPLSNVHELQQNQLQQHPSIYKVHFVSIIIFIIASHALEIP